jgi:hypothetical protein
VIASNGGHAFASTRCVLSAGWPQDVTLCDNGWSGFLKFADCQINGGRAIAAVVLHIYCSHSSSNQSKNSRNIPVKLQVLLVL